MAKNNANDPATADRRKFLATAGKFAVVVPPAMTMLLSTTLTSPAIAASGKDSATFFGGNGNGNNGNGNGNNGNGNNGNNGNSGNGNNGNGNGNSGNGNNGNH